MSSTESLVVSRRHKENTEAADGRTNHELYSYNMTASFERNSFLRPSNALPMILPTHHPSDTTLMRYGQSSFLAGFTNDILDTIEDNVAGSSGRVPGKTTPV
jgi:hypothetical protein